jgi:hypothetical protein
MEYKEDDDNDNIDMDDVDIEELKDKLQAQLDELNDDENKNESQKMENAKAVIGTFGERFEQASGKKISTYLPSADCQPQFRDVFSDALKDAKTERVK